MKVYVRYFASFKDMTGKKEEVIEVQGRITVQRLKKIVRDMYPKIANKEQVLVAVNGTFTSIDKEIREGDEIAFFPPVSGG